MSSPYRVKPYEGNEPYIFVSYKRADEEIAYDIIEELGMRSYRVWYDADHLVNDYAEHTLAERISNCAFFLCVLSEAYTNDPRSRRELNFAFSNNKTVLPIMIEDFQLPEMVRYVIARFHWFSLSQFESVRKIIDRICEVDDPVLRSCIDRPVRKPERKTGFFERLTGKRK